MSSLKNQVAFITGAAHGQGRAVALALANEGVHIVAFDVAKQLSYPGYKLASTNDLGSLKKEVEKLGVQCLTFQGDVRVDADIKIAISETILHFKRIDILFNNA